MNNICKQIKDNELKHFIGCKLKYIYLWNSYDNNSTNNEHFAFVNFAIMIDDSYYLVSNDDGCAKIGDEVFDFNDFQIEKITESKFIELSFDKHIDLMKNIKSVKVVNERQSFLKNTNNETNIDVTRAFVFCFDDNDEVAVVRSIEEWNSEINIKFGDNLAEDIIKMDDGSSYWETEMKYEVERKVCNIE